MNMNMNMNKNKNSKNQLNVKRLLAKSGPGFSIRGCLHKEIPCSCLDRAVARCGNFTFKTLPSTRLSRWCASSSCRQPPIKILRQLLAYNRGVITSQKWSQNFDSYSYSCSYSRLKEFQL